MFKHKIFIFIILILALLSIGIASAEDSTALNITDTQGSVVSACGESNFIDEISVSESDDSNIISFDIEDNSSDVNSPLESDNTIVSSQEDVNSNENSLDANSYESGDFDNTNNEITNSNNITIDGNKYNATSKNNGEYVTTVGSLGVGAYEVTASYPVNDSDVEIVSPGYVYVASDFIYVNVTGGRDNDGEYTGSSEKPYATIGYAISKINDDQKNNCIIILSGGIHKVNSQVDIKCSTTILGQSGTIITSENKHDWIFKISASNVVIANCIFANITTSNNDRVNAIIMNAVSKSIINNCTFINNNVTSLYGSTVHNYYNDQVLTITNSKFENNTAVKCADIFNCGDLNLTNNTYSVGKTNVYNSNNGKIVSPVTVTVSSDTVNYRNKLDLSATVTADGASVAGGTLTFSINGATPKDAESNDNGTYTVTDNGITSTGNYGVNATYLNVANLTVGTANINVESYIYVNATGGDDGNNGSSWNSPYATISNAVNNVIDGGIIYLSNGTHKVSKTIFINKIITLVGQNGTVITGNKDIRVFYVMVSNVKIANSTFASPAIYGSNQAKYLIVSNCTFSNITGGEYGAAIYNDAEGLSVINSTFINNTVTQNGGVIINTGKNAVVNNSTFINSKANNNGGAIRNTGNNLTVSNSRFINSTAATGVDISNDGAGSINVTNNVYSDVSDKANIENAGKIISPIIITVLGNKTVTGVYGEKITLSATVTADGASVAGETLTFTSDGDIIDGAVTSNANGTYTLEGYKLTVGKKVINVTYSGTTSDVTVKTGSLDISKANATVDVKLPGTININNNNEIIVTITPEEAAFDNGVTMTINGITCILTKKDGNKFIFTAPNLDRGVYKLAVTYNGNDNYNSSVTTLNFPVGIAYVDSINGNDNNKGSNWDDAFATIKHAVDKVGTGGIIYLSNGTHIIAEQIGIDKALTIIGQSGTVITDNGTDDGNRCVFAVEGNVEIANCTFANITATETNGGAIYNVGKLTVSNTTFINITPRGTGAVIYNARGTLSVINSTFKNTPDNNCYDIYNMGTLNVTNNKYSEVTKGKTNIYNTGNIISPVIINVSGNTTINDKVYGNVNLTATITTADGASVASNITLKVGNVEITTLGPVNGTYSGVYEIGADLTYYIISVNYDHSALKNVTILNSILDTRTVPNVTVTINDIIYGEDLIVNVTVTPEDVTGDVTIIIKDSNGTVVVTDTVSVNEANNYTIPNQFGPGNYTADIRYNGYDGEYAFYSTSTKFTINKVSDYNVISIVNNINVGENNTILVFVPEIASGIVSTTINGKQYNATINHGISVIRDISGLTVGTYDINITYSGDNIFVSKTVADQFSVDKLSNYTIDVTTQDIGVGENATVKVNISAEDADGKVFIYVDGKVYEGNVSNGIANVNLTNLTYGKHYITVNYIGNDKYESRFVISSVNVSKVSKYAVVITAGSINVGENATITVNVPGDAEGIIIIYIDGSTQGHVADIIDGVAKFNISGLGDGTHNITATFNGDDKYAENSNKSSIKVFKVGEFNMNVTTENIKVGDNAIIKVNVPADATGKVNITVNNKNYTVNIIDGVATFNVTGLANGTYEITAIYYGDDKYAQFTNVTSITVSKVSGYEFNISADPIEVGDNATIIVTVPTDAKGEITIYIDGNKQGYTVGIIDGLAKFNIPGLKEEGTHNITVTFNGDDKYVKSNVTSKITVSKVAEYPIEITVPSDVKVGDEAVINVALPVDATGNVTIKVGNKTYNTAAKGGVATITTDAFTKADNYDITVTFEGDDKYAKFENTSSIAVSQVSSYDMHVKVPTDVEVDEDFVIIVDILPTDATGKVTITINGENFTGEVKDGIAYVEIDGLDSAASYEVKVNYSGDNKYTGSTDTTYITISRISGYDMTIDVTKDVKVGQDATIKVTVPDGAQGDVIISVDGVDYTVVINDGVASITFDNLTAGSHTIAVQYEGDGKYADNYATGNITVSKVNNYNMDITADPIKVGENAIIEVTVPEDVEGRIILTIDGSNHVASIIDGVATFDIADLGYGKHDITATFDGDDKYTKNQEFGEITVSKVDVCSMSISVSGDVKVGNQAVINVALPVDATGNVTVIFNGKQYNTTAKNGLATITTDEITEATDYEVVVTYEGDDKYNLVTDNYSFTVSKVNPTMNITASNIVYTQNETVIINLPEDVNGKAIIFVDGQQDSIVDVINGKASGSISGLTAGNHTIAVKYVGNNKYTEISEDVIINVAKANSKLDVNIDDVVYNGVFIINATLTNLNDAQLDGTVVVTINGQTYNVTVKNGKGSLEGITLNANDYYFTAKWNGDNNYNGAETTGKFNVAQANPTLNVNIKDVNYGEIFKITATLAGVGNTPLNGFVGVIVNGEEYIVRVVDGEGVLNGTKLPAASSYDFTATWEGNNNYKEVTDIGSFSVAKVNPTLNVNIEDVNYGEIFKITANLTGVENTPLNGFVSVIVDGEEYIVHVVGGVGSIDGIKLPAASAYDFTATWEGDSNYNGANDENSFSVAKVNPEFSTFVEDIKVGEDETINFALPDDATGDVNITVGNMSYTVSVEDAMKVISDLKAGNYTAIVTYKGDNNYNSVTSECNFTVSKNDPNMECIYYPGMEYGTDSDIMVILPADATGNVTVIINGTSYPIEMDDGFGYVRIPTLDAGNYKFIISYDGNDKYENFGIEGNFDVFKVDPTLNVVIDNNVYGKNSTIVATLNGVNNSPLTGNVVVTINNKNYTIIVVDGKGILNNVQLSAGDYNFTAMWDGNNNYNSVQDTGSFNIAKIDPNINVLANDINVGEDEEITVFLPEDVTGEVIITVNEVDYKVKVENGIAKQVISGLKTENETSLSYLVHVKYLGDNNYNNITALDEMFTVSKVSGYNINITVPSDVKVGDEATINVSLPSDATGNVTVTIDGQKYTEKVENGSVEITVPSLPVDEYDVTIDYSGDGKYLPSSVNKTLEVISGDVNLTADDVVMIYKDGSRLYAVLLDAKGNPIADATISFAINNVIYNRTTDENGSASIALNLDSGVYDVVISYAGNKTYNPSSVNATVEVKSSIIGDDLVKMYQNDTQFYATFLGKDGKVLANTTVRFNINGVFYNRTTDENGTARLAINLNPGNYTLTAYNPINGEEKGFNVLVKSLIESNDLTKYYQNASKFEAKIYNKDGSIAVNKTVTFNVNGVFYTRTTDEKGTVKLAINLKPGNYTITTMYDGLSVGNKVCVLPTLETADLSMVSGDGSSFQAKTLDGQGNPLANQSVTFNVNGVFYHRTTSDDGIAKLTINLARGQYTITSIWDSYQIGNKISIS